jgi:ABC-2 type transport system ATP-binding protein
MPMTAVQANGLVKRFETTCALDGVDLLVGEGEVHGLLGPNGAGKTTLLRLLFGLVAPDAGTIELFGRPVDSHGPLPLDGIAGFVEEPSFYPYLSGRANLELFAELDGGENAGRIPEILERVGLGARGDDRVSGYSTGMRQRLGIGSALLRTPRLLLLDEPTSGLDPAGARDVRALVRDLCADGVAVLLSSHQIGEIEDVCDGFTVLRRGEVVWTGTAAELRAQAPGSAYSLATSDDGQAIALAAGQPAVAAMPAPNGGISLTADDASLDRYALALGQAGIAIRRLELLVSPLESMFFALTGEPSQDPEAARAERVLSGDHP